MAKKTKMVKTLIMKSTDGKSTILISNPQRIKQMEPHIRSGASQVMDIGSGLLYNVSLADVSKDKLDNIDVNDQE